MGYACPVCAAPQADGEHLANHLAFSAILRHDEHEDWLDEHAPDWSSDDPAGLAATVVAFVDETDYPEVFEDTTDHLEHDHPVGGEHEPGATPQQPMRGPQPGEHLTAEAEEILAEARELTEERRRARDSDSEEEPDDGDS